MAMVRYCITDVLLYPYGMLTSNEVVNFLLNKTLQMRGTLGPWLRSPFLEFGGPHNSLNTTFIKLYFQYRDDAENPFNTAR